MHILNLTFPMVEYGVRETPWDLHPLLYRGGAVANVKEVSSLIGTGKLGSPIIERIELVTHIHEVLTAKLVGGGSKPTAYSTINSIRNFFAWADQREDQPLTIESAPATFRHWTDALLNRARLKGFSNMTAYGLAASVSTVLDEISERATPLIATTRLKFPKKGKRTAGGVEADKQNLADTFAFGHLLFDVIDGLSGDAIWGPLPIRIPLRTGEILEEWSRLKKAETLASLQPGYREKSNMEKVIATRSAWDNDRTLRTRFPLANLRIEADLLVFIAQTGMNLAQAHQLKICQFSYKSTIDGYEIRDYKHRRQGEVLFEIFAEYKPVFENYLTWRKNLFPDSEDLFPFVRAGGRATSTARKFRRVSDICKKIGTPFITPKQLRKTRINWLLRRSRDPNLTAEQAQHTKETLLRVYEQPSQQVAMIEIIQFWPQFDPSLNNDPKPCPAPGVCNGVPQPIPNIPPEAPKPDCSQPSGCLFCGHHRDIDSEDYLWSVASMRHLKTIVLRGFRPKKNDKTDSARHVELAIEVLTAKLKWFRDSNDLRRGWVEEAVERVGEGDAHPHWRYLIESAEGV